MAERRHRVAMPMIMSSQEKRSYLATFKFPYANDYGKYEKIKKIGQGTFGEVWKAVNKVTGETVAMKKILTDNEHQGFPITAMREIRILKRVKNENIVHLKEVVTTQVTSIKGYHFTHYLVFEFCEYDLSGLLSTENLFFHLGEIKTLIKQLLLGLHYLHHNKMLHRDMKSSNVLVNREGMLKLADFGLSRAFSEQRIKPLTNRVVTLWYRPPELLLGERLYTPKIDVWGAGCIMAEMWTRCPILRGSSEQGQLALISDLCGSINTDIWPSVNQLHLYNKMYLEQGLPRRVIAQLRPFIMDAVACDLLDKLLTLDPTKRLDTDGALDHDFFFSDPMPVNISVLKETFSKIATEKFEYFTNKQLNYAQYQQQLQQQQQQHQQYQQQLHQRHHQQLQQQHQRHQQHQQYQQQQCPRHNAGTNYYDRVC